MADWLACGVLAAAVGLAVARLRRDRREGKRGCGGDCGRCRGWR